MENKNIELRGIIKRVDNLGRICIPKAMRQLYGLSYDVELIVTGEGVLIRPVGGIYKQRDDGQ